MNDAQGLTAAAPAVLDKRRIIVIWHQWGVSGANTPPAIHISPAHELARQIFGFEAGYAMHFGAIARSADDHGAVFPVLRDARSTGCGATIDASVI